MAVSSVESGDVVKVVLEWDMPNQVVANTVFHWYRSDVAGASMTFPDFLDDVNAVIDDYLDELDLYISDLVSTTQITGYVVAYVGGEWVTEGLMGQDALIHAFTNATEMLPHGAAALISYPTLYPRVRGRHYLPGMAEGSCVDGEWLAACKTALEAFGTLHIAGWTGGGGETFAACVAGNTGQPRILQSRKVADFPAYQRRRRP